MERTVVLSCEKAVSGAGLLDAPRSGSAIFQYIRPVPPRLLAVVCFLTFVTSAAQYLTIHFGCCIAKSVAASPSRWASLAKHTSSFKAEP
jgi:hypothetical protein